MGRVRVCALCGEAIVSDDLSMDHFVPRAVDKWVTKELRPKQRVKIHSAILSQANLLSSHKGCNFAKLDAIMSIEELYINSKAELNRVTTTYTICQPAINRYLFYKKNVLDRQEGKCYICRQPLQGRSSTIRRINNVKERRWDNACIVCSECNSLINYFPRDLLSDKGKILRRIFR